MHQVVNEQRAALARIQTQVMWNRLIAVVEEQARRVERGRLAFERLDDALHRPLGDQAVVVDHVTFFVGQVAPDDVAAVVQVDVVDLQFALGDRERQRPLAVVFDGFDEFAGNQQRQVELAQAAGFGWPPAARPAT